MSVGLVKIIYSLNFYSDVKGVRDWLIDNVSAKKGHDFIIELNDFLNQKVIPFPTQFMEYRWWPTPRKMYRRTIFKKKYVILYKYLGHSIEFLAFYHQKRNPEKIKL